MKRTPVIALHELGQSVWLDNINAGLIESGELQRLIPSFVKRAKKSERRHWPNGLNRTIVGLKRKSTWFRICKKTSLNRTIVGLKLDPTKFIRPRPKSLNRTIVGLKPNTIMPASWP